MRFSTVSGAIVAAALASALYAPSAGATVLFNPGVTLSTYTNQNGFDSFISVGAPNVQYVQDNIKVDVTGTVSGVINGQSGGVGNQKYIPVNLFGTVSVSLNDGSWFNGFSVDAGVWKLGGGSSAVPYNFHERVYYDGGLTADFYSLNAVYDGYQSFETITTQGEQINRIDLTVTPAGLGFQFPTNSINLIQLDNIRINDPTPLAGGVPEPASWALMIMGFGLAGATLRRRRALSLASA